MTEIYEQNRQVLPKEPPVNAQYLVELSDDLLQARLLVSAPEHGGKEIELSAIYQALKNAGVVYGLRDRELKMLALSKGYGQKILAAQGTAAQNGKDGEIIERFLLGAQGVPRVNVDGTVDHKDLNLIYNVTQGQVLCEITAPTAGEKGKTVLGQDIMPYPGREARPPIGRNVRLSEDGSRVVSEVDGTLSRRNMLLDVTDTFVVNGDVDYSSGNLDFIGNIVIKGDVKSGFSVKAGGTIRVNGLVEAANLSAQKGLSLSGVNGRGGGRLYCGENISANFLENVKVEAKGSITANAILYCEIRCGSVLELKGPNGCLIGGTAIVRQDVISKCVGSPFHARTELVLGSATELVDEMNSTTARLQQVDYDIRRLSQAISYLSEKDINTLSPERVKMFEQAQYNRQLLQDEKEALTKRYEEMVEELHRPISSKIICKSTLYSGTRISMGSLAVSVTEDHNNTMVYYSDDGIVFGTA